MHDSILFINPKSPEECGDHIIGISYSDYDNWFWVRESNMDLSHYRVLNEETVLLPFCPLCGREHDHNRMRAWVSEPIEVEHGDH